MNVLVFEYITGGGLNKQALPESLLQEGRLMLEALLESFRDLMQQPHYAHVSVVVMLDVRLQQHINTAGFATVIIDSEQDCYTEFIRNTAQCAAVWPVAPEFDDILYKLCLIVEHAKKQLLTSPATAVALTGNKFNSYLHFKKHQISTVPTWPYQPDAEDIPQQLNALLQEISTEACTQWIIKPVAGVGCMDSYVLPTIDSLKQMGLSRGDYIIQPHIKGEKLSLSCLFKAGKAWLLSVNQQHFTLYDQQYHLEAISVNVSSEQKEFIKLIGQIAQAIPDLWGYVGIDLIKTPMHTFVLEINPRLTTSFVGIQSALGINGVQNILALLDGQPRLNMTKQQTITLKVRDGSTD